MARTAIDAQKKIAARMLDCARATAMQKAMQATSAETPGKRRPIQMTSSGAGPPEPVTVRSASPSTTSVPIRYHSVTIRRSLQRSHPSCASCRLPQLRRRQAFPAERVVARPMALEMFQPFDRLLDCWNMACWHPPHDEVGAVELLEPFLATAIETLVHGLPDVSFQRGHVFPDRHVDSHARIIAIRAIAGRVAARILQSPDEALSPVGNRIHPREIVDEVGHARVTDLVAQASDVQLSEVSCRLRCHRSTPPRPARDAGSRCIDRCAARSRDGSGAAAPAPARLRRRRRRRWYGPRSGW